jgi:hypothetical protein
MRRKTYCVPAFQRLLAHQLAGAAYLMLADSLHPHLALSPTNAMEENARQRLTVLCRRTRHPAPHAVAPKRAKKDQPGDDMDDFFK